MTIEGKIYELYKKTDQNGFCCINEFPEVTPATIRLARVTQFESLMPVNLITIRFEQVKIPGFQHLDGWEGILYIKGLRQESYHIKSTEDFDNAIKSMNETLVNKGYLDYASLIWEDIDRC